MKSIKILCIGNSFSCDMSEYAPRILADLGYTVTFGNLHIGGCSLSTHLMHARSGDRDYEFFTSSGGEWVSRPAGLQEGILSSDWEIITLQQASGFSGISESYRANLWDLIDYVRRTATNPEVKLYWHKTWTYSQEFDHEYFNYYNRSQEVMYRAITNCVENEVLPTNAFSGVIPNGEVIRQGRKIFQETLNRDGFHLSIPLGRYLAALSLVKKVTGESLFRVRYAPDGLTEEVREQAVRCVEEVFTVANE